MHLLDIANLLNKRHEQIVKAEEERVRQEEARLRRQSYYDAFGKKWFSEIVTAADELVAAFNATTGDHSKLIRHPKSDISDDSILVGFVKKEDQPTEQVSTCTISRDVEDLKLLVRTEHESSSGEERYEILVKKFSELVVRVDTVVRRQSLGEGVQWKDRESGDMQYEPTFVTKTVKNTHELTAREFADFVLARFAEKMLDR